MIDKLLLRIQELEVGLDQAVANYNATKGALEEARNLYQTMMRESVPSENVVDAEPCEPEPSQEEFVPVE